MGSPDREAAQSKDNPADLINVALEELVRGRHELPGHTILDDLAVRCGRGGLLQVAGSRRLEVGLVGWVHEGEVSRVRSTVITAMCPVRPARQRVGETFG